MKSQMQTIEPRRFGHAVVQQGHCILVFGGAWRENGSLQRSPLNDMRIYNLYIEQWKKHMITDSRTTPSGRTGASATAIASDIYMFGGMVNCKVTNSLWKLGRTLTGCFAWCQIKSTDEKKSPSPRQQHSAWEFANKLWIFGGYHLYDVFNKSDYLNDYGDYSIASRNANNQVLCFDPSCKEWTNPQAFGNIPEPRYGHGTAIIRDKAWLFGGCNMHRVDPFDELYQLDMHSLTWTMIATSEVKPYHHTSCILTAITENQLVMAYGKSKVDEHSKINIWILDLSTMSWKAYSTAAGKDREPRLYHTCTQGFNSRVMIIGIGDYQCFHNYCNDPNQKLETWTNVHITLEAKSLQQLAMQTIWKHKSTLCWQEILPRKLRSLFGFLGDFQVQPEDIATRDT